MIELKCVSKTYKSGGFLKKKRFSRGVEKIDLQIGPGAFGLLGINGAGKTTILKMIATLLRPTTGSISLDGKDTVKDEKSLREVINMITGSDRMLYFRLSGRENLHYFGSLYGLGYRETKRRACELLELTGLGGAADKRVEEYSRGMKQRLAIARGLINDPKILLLDEPTLGLDVAIAAEIRSFIRENLLGDRKRTVILTSHYMAEIESLCEEIGILQEGRLIYRGDFEGLYARMGMEEAHRFSFPLEFYNKKEEIESLLGFIPDWKSERNSNLAFTLENSDGYRFLKNMDRLGITGLSYSQEKPGLEEAIVRLSRSVL